MTKKRQRFPIYNRYLKIKTSKPITVIMGAVMPFLQATIGSMLQLFVTANDIKGTSIVAFFYWTMFAVNGKRVALGGWKAISLFIIFATLGTLFGMHISSQIM